MKRLAPIFLLFLFLIGTFARNDNFSISQQPKQNKGKMAQGEDTIASPFMPGIIVMKYAAADHPLQIKQQNGVVKTSSNSINTLLTQFHIQSIRRPFPPTRRFPRRTRHADLTRIYYLRFPKTQDVQEVAAAFAALPEVEYAEPLYIRKKLEVPNDPYYNQQGHLAVIQAAAAWDVQHGDTSIIIGICDSGVDLDHPDIQANLWTNPGEIPGNNIDDDGNGYIDDIHGWDFVGADINNVTPDGDPTQKYDEHGTHVAGIADAVTNNGIGVAGVAWNCRIMVTKQAPDASSNYIYYGYDGITYLAENGADIINCSWGGFGFSQYEQEIINYAYDLGALVVAAAGNDSPSGSYAPPQTPPPQYPSSYNHVLSVAATNNQDEITSWSFYGPYVDVAAPGEGLLSTVPSATGVYDLAYERLSGTSMASPLVAGLAALVKSVHPDWGPDQITSQIKNTADDISQVGDNPSYVAAGGFGSGRVNAYRAVSQQASPQFKLLQIIYNDSLGGNGNLKPEPGETIHLQLRLKNVWGNATGVVAQLSSNDYAIQILDNTSVLGDLPGGKTIYNNFSDDFTFQINSDVLPHFVPLVLQFTTAENYVQTDTIRMALKPLVLFIDDDDGINNIEHYYTEVLDTLGVVYEYWAHANRDLPTNKLMDYPVVIWACEWSFPSLDENDRAELQKYLDAGGKLFLSGQDIGWDLADPSGANVPNEYGKSNGASLQFYNNYLRANYLADKSSYNELSGVPGDPIADGLQFHVYQPGRNNQQQFPSEISPMNGSVSLFDYPNGHSGAIRYNNGYRLVYFAFGGYEAIVEDAVRRAVMPRILSWLVGIDVDHTPLRDTEATESSYPVTVTVHSHIDSIKRVELYWNTTDTFPYQKITMVPVNDSVYTAEIPATHQVTDVYYFVYVETNAGTYIPILKHRFHVGPDVVPPKISLMGSPQPNTIDLSHPFTFTVYAEDNINLDSSSARIHYWREGEPPTEAPLQLIHPNTFQGSFSLDPTQPRAGWIYYYFSIRDASSNHNVGITDTFAFSDTTEFIDGFENGTEKWDLGKKWAIAASRWHTGRHSIADSKIGKYPNNFRDSLTYKGFFDFSHVKSAWITYFIRYDLEMNKDFLYFQVSDDSGKSWKTLQSITGRKGFFTQKSVYLRHFTGPGEDHVTFRFLIVTDSTGQADGVFIDDISVIVSDKITGISHGEKASIPQHFYLKQNYPNPFNPTTKIEYGIAKTTRVNLVVYNVLGQRVRTLVNALQKPGRYTVQWDGKDDRGRPVPTGIYFYQLITPQTVKTKKLLLLK